MSNPIGDMLPLFEIPLSLDPCHINHATLCVPTPSQLGMERKDLNMSSLRAICNAFTTAYPRQVSTS